MWLFHLESTLILPQGNRTRGIQHEGLQLPRIEIVSTMRTPFHDGRPGIAKMQLNSAPEHWRIWGLPAPPQQDQILSFSHSFLPKSAHVGRFAPPPPPPPQREILDPPLPEQG